MNTTAIAAIAGSVVGLIGVLIAQYLTQQRHSQGLQRSAELEAQRANKDALMKYFELVGQLLTDPSKSEGLMPVIRAQTLTLLEGLGPGHKRILLLYLYELNLLDTERPDLSLRGANLHKANLVDANGSRANLEEANLVDVNGSRANLEEANLERANLERANLAEANLVAANLRKANLGEAHLVDANLYKAELEEANLVDANLRRANLRGANLKQADLSGAFLQETTEESLTQTQINGAVGNDATKLPDHLQRPAHWSKGESRKS